MSRRHYLILVLIFIAVVIAGYFFGKAVLPRIILRILDDSLESPGTSYTGGGLAVTTFNPSASNPFNQAPDAPAENLGPNPHEAPDVQHPDSHDDQTADMETGGFSDLWIEVNVTEQLVRIMDGDQVIKEMIASTGKEGRETPLGTFEIQNRGTWFYNEKYQQGAKYWVSFKDWGLYLFHWVAMDKDRQVIQEEAGKMGQPASRGCVRLSIEDAKWIYNNVMEINRVVIRK